MRRYLIIVLVFLAGCAGNQPIPQQNYTAPLELQNRLLYSAHEVSTCMGIQAGVSIMGTQSPYASMNPEGDLTVSEGIVKWEHDALRLVIAHELAHKQLNHIRNAQITSYAVTGVMTVVNIFIPGAGYLNHLINPSVVHAFSREQELDADKAASEACLKCFNTSISRQVEIFKYMKSIAPDGGGFWDNHPSWDDRINNISASAP